jgi:hypothetical protein
MPQLFATSVIILAIIIYVLVRFSPLKGKLLDVEESENLNEGSNNVI